MATPTAARIAREMIARVRTRPAPSPGLVEIESLTDDGPGGTPAPPTQDPVEGVDLEFKAVAAFAARFLLIVAALYVLWRMLDAVGLLTITITVAVMISALLRPFVNMLVRLGMGRWLSASFVFTLGVAAFSALAWFVISQITDSADVVIAQLQNANREIFLWLVNGPLQMSQDQIAQIFADLGNLLATSQTQVISSVFATASSVVTLVSGVILCLFTVLFLLLDNGTIWRWVVTLFPQRARSRVSASGGVAWRTLVAYMRSTVLLAVINAMTMVVVMMIGKIELYVPLGVLLFLGSLIPMVGMLVAGFVLVLIALVMNGPVTALVMGIALFLTIQIEGNLLNAYILGRAVSIHPLAVLAAVTGGTLAGGIFGAFIAVPLIAVINNVSVALRDGGLETTALLGRPGDLGESPPPAI